MNDIDSEALATMARWRSRLTAIIVIGLGAVALPLFVVLYVSLRELSFHFAHMNFPYLTACVAGAPAGGLMVYGSRVLQRLILRARVPTWIDAFVAKGAARAPLEEVLSLWDL